MTVTKRLVMMLCLASVALGLRGQQPSNATRLSLPAGGQRPAQQTPQPANTGKPETPASFGDVQQQVMQSNFESKTEYYDYSGVQLPPLDVLFESARNNPRVEYYNYRKVEEQAELKSVKRTWLKYFRLNTSYQYGLMGMTTNVENDPTLPAYYTYSDQAQSWWSIGAGIAFPLDEIFDRRNRIRKQQARINQTDYEVEMWHNEQKLAIIQAYTDASMHLALIPIKSEAATISTRQYLVSQAEFVNGRMDLIELTRQKAIQNAAVTEYEQTRVKLYEAILRLETLANYQVLNR